MLVHRLRPECSCCHLHSHRSIDIFQHRQESQVICRCLSQYQLQPHLEPEALDQVALQDQSMVLLQSMVMSTQVRSNHCR